MNESNARVTRNILSLLATQVGSWMVTLVLTLVVPHYLGINVFGLYSFIGTFVGFFTLGMSVGAGTYLTWRIAREPGEAAALTFNTLALQLPLGVVFGALALTTLPLFAKHEHVLPLTVALLLSSMLSTLTATCIAGLNGLQIMRTPAMIGLGTAALGAGLTITCVILDKGVQAVAIVSLISQGLTFLAILAYAQRKLHMRPAIDLGLWPRIVRGGLPFFIWSVVLTWYWQIDIPLLKLLSGPNSDAVVGWYAAANRIIGIPVFLPNIIVTALLPALSRERSADSPEFRALASRALRLVIAINIPASVGTMMLAPGLTSLLHYPANFAPLEPLIVILAWNMPLVALDMVLGTILVSIGKQRLWTVVGVAAAVVNPLVNLWAIPFAQQHTGNGAIAASLTTIMSELIMFIGAMALRPKGIFTGADLFYVMRCLLAAGMMAPAVWGLSQQRFIGAAPAVVYGLVIYVAVAYLLRVFTDEDIKKLVGVVGARLGIENAEGVTVEHMRVIIRTRITHGPGIGRIRHISAALPIAVTTSLARAPLGVERARAIIHAQVHASIARGYLRVANRQGWPRIRRMAPSGIAPSGVALANEAVYVNVDEAMRDANEAITEPMPVTRTLVAHGEQAGQVEEQTLPAEHAVPALAGATRVDGPLGQRPAQSGRIKI